LAAVSWLSFGTSSETNLAASLGVAKNLHKFSNTALYFMISIVTALIIDN